MKLEELRVYNIAMGLGEEVWKDLEGFILRRLRISVIMPEDRYQRQRPGSGRPMNEILFLMKSLLISAV